MMMKQKVGKVEVNWSFSGYGDVTTWVRVVASWHTGGPKALTKKRGRGRYSKRRAYDITILANMHVCICFQKKQQKRPVLYVFVFFFTLCILDYLVPGTRYLQYGPVPGYPYLVPVPVPGTQGGVGGAKSVAF